MGVFILKDWNHERGSTKGVIFELSSASSRPVFWFVLLSRSFYCFRWHGYCVITSSIVFFSQSQILSGNVQACSKIIWPPDRVLYSLLKYIKLSAFADYILISPNWSEQKFLNDNFSLFKYELLVNSRLV